MITKVQLHILRSISIALLFIMTKPENLFQLFLGLFLFMGAMFLDWEILGFAKGEQDE